MSSHGSQARRGRVLLGAGPLRGGLLAVVLLHLRLVRAAGGRVGAVAGPEAPDVGTTASAERREAERGFDEERVL